MNEHLFTKVEISIKYNGKMKKLRNFINNSGVGKPLDSPFQERVGKKEVHGKGLTLENSARYLEIFLRDQ
jgi:hypothetical protein